MVASAQPTAVKPALPAGAHNHCLQPWVLLRCLIPTPSPLLQPVFVQLMQISSCQGTYSRYSCGTVCFLFSSLRRNEEPPQNSRLHSCPEDQTTLVQKEGNPQGPLCFRVLPLCCSAYPEKTGRLLQIVYIWNVSCPHMKIYTSLRPKYLCLEIEWTSPGLTFCLITKPLLMSTDTLRGMFPYVEAKQMLDISFFVCIYVCSYVHTCTTCDVIYHTNSMYLF